VDGLVLRDRDTDANGTLDERLYSLQDANWNTTALVNTSGTIQERYTYTPFGQVTFRDGSGFTLSSSAKDWVFLHQGGERIAAGDYEFRNRVYSPSLGRWLSNDPLGFEAGDQNWYRYVGNGPVNGLDSNGLEKKEIGGMWFEFPAFGNWKQIKIWFFNYFGQNSKQECLGKVPICKKADLPLLAPAIATGCTGAKGWVGVIPEGGYVGPSGCGPCVGIVLIPPKPSMKTYVLHIEPKNDVEECLIISGLLELGICQDIEPVLPYFKGPKGYKAIICGAEQAEIKYDDCERLRNLYEVTSVLRWYGIPIKSYIAGPCFAVDKNGNPFWTAPPNESGNTYEK